MKHVSYTIPGHVDKHGEPIVYGGFALPGNALPVQTRAASGLITTPASVKIVNERDVKQIDFLPEADV